MNLLLLSVVLVIGQQGPLPPQAPPIRGERLPQAPPLIEENPPPVAPKVAPKIESVRPTYDAQARRAISERKPLVCFVGSAPRDIAGMIVCQREAWDDQDEFIVVAVADGKGWLKELARLPAGATDDHIRRVARQVQPQMADPFDLEWAPGAGRPTADDKSQRGPWLPDAEQKAILAMFPKGVPVSRNLRFYRLPQRAQSLYFLDGSPRRDIVPATEDSGSPWSASGGLHAAPKSEWRNVTALDIPDGAKISLWEELVEAGAPGPVQKWFWKFPAGVLAYDVLIRRGNPEHVFEVRVQEKLDDGRWDDGTTYRPKVDGGEKWWHKWSFPVEGIQAHQRSVYYVDSIPLGTEFVATKRLVVDDGGFTPKGYHGTGVSCATCHDRVSERTGYGTARRGGDSRFSWHPFTESGAIDSRWPIARK